MLIGGKKMSSSKGLGLKARDLTDFLPVEVGRFLFIKTDYRKQVEFEPIGTNAIPVLFDEYQKAAEAYFDKKSDDLGRAFEFSQIKEVKKPPSVRFSVLAQWVQMPSMDQEIKEKGLEDWAKYAKVWVERFAPENDKFMIQEKLPEEAKKLSDKQKNLLSEISKLLDKKWKAEDLQTEVYSLGKELGLTSTEAFEAFYIVLIGKNHGPKLAWLILSLDKDFAKKRFEEAAKS